MGSEKEAKYLAYSVTKSNGFEKGARYFDYFVTKSSRFGTGSEVLGLLFHKEQWVRKRKQSTWLTLSQRVMGSKKEARYFAYFVTKSSSFGKGSEVLGLLCHKEQWVRKRKQSTWLTLSQRVMGSKKEARYFAYFVTKSSSFGKGKSLVYFVIKSNGFGKGSKVLGLLCHKAFEKGSRVLFFLCHKE